jgi:CspA family cold shock protein
MSTNKDIVTLSTSEQLTGRVKWFNNKAGYGFITVTDGERSGSDIFVHHSTIKVDNQQYKYLVQGEYVDFSIAKTTSGDHEYQAVDVHGIKGGKLMCETRHEYKLARTVYKESSVETEMPVQQRVPKEERLPRVRSEGPSESDNRTWSLVDKNLKTKKSRSKQQLV